MSPIQRRILEHLATVGVLLAPGCHEPKPSITATAPASVATSAAPVASVTASSSSKLGQTCTTDPDCGLDLFCRLEFDGATFSKTGTCTSERPVYKGRPLLIEGAARVATLDRAETPSSDAWTQYFARAAAEEHASVAAFARTICQLMALGAPLDLLARTQQALADEIEHTRGSLAWLRRLDRADAQGPSDALGVLPEAVAPIADAALGLDALARALVVDVIHGGCVGETLAAEAMLQRAAQAPDPELATWLERVADDEARHAALAFETVAWLVTQRPELAAVVHIELAALPPAVSARIEPLARACGLSRSSA
jgi:hypothetical protein